MERRQSAWDRELYLGDSAFSDMWWAPRRYALFPASSARGGKSGRRKKKKRKAWAKCFVLLTPQWQQPLIAWRGAQVCQLSAWPRLAAAADEATRQSLLLMWHFNVCHSIAPPTSELHAPWRMSSRENWNFLLQRSKFDLATFVLS